MTTAYPTSRQGLVMMMACRKTRGGEFLPDALVHFG